MRYLLLLLLVSCGYSMKGGELAEKYTTLSIPYVKGDDDGTITTALIDQMAKTGQFSIVYSGSLLRMDAKVASDRFTQVGYQYDRPPTKENKQITRLVPNEERRELALEITLVDVSNSKVVFGPKIVSASVDFDFVDSDAIQDLSTSGSTSSILSFSLGQLDSIEGAHDASLEPAAKAVAKKVAIGLLAVELFDD